MKEIPIGTKGSKEIEVTARDTAKVYGSGLLPVFATPAMIALMEQTALTSIEAYLEEGEGSVGIKLDVAHLAATPIGMSVRCESEVTEVDRRRIVFAVRAYDEAGLIGEGTHERFVILSGPFMEKAMEKLNGKT